MPPSLPAFETLPLLANPYYWVTFILLVGLTLYAVVSFVYERGQPSPEASAAVWPIRQLLRLRLRLRVRRDRLSRGERWELVALRQQVEQDRLLTEHTHCPLCLDDDRIDDLGLRMATGDPFPCRYHFLEYVENHGITRAQLEHSMPRMRVSLPTMAQQLVEMQD